MSYSEEARPGWDDLLKSELCISIIFNLLVEAPSKPTNFDSETEMKLLDSIFLYQ